MSISCYPGARSYASAVLIKWFDDPLFDEWQRAARRRRLARLVKRGDGVEASRGAEAT
jgi:hypothetical protein